MKRLAAWLLLGSALWVLPWVPAHALSATAGLRALELGGLSAAAAEARQPSGGSPSGTTMPACTSLEAEGEDEDGAVDGPGAPARKPKRVRDADDPAGVPRGAGRPPGWRALLPGALR